MKIWVIPIFFPISPFNISVFSYIILIFGTVSLGTAASSLSAV